MNLITVDNLNGFSALYCGLIRFLNLDGVFGREDGNISRFVPGATLCPNQEPGVSGSAGGFPRPED